MGVVVKLPDTATPEPIAKGERFVVTPRRGRYLVQRILNDGSRVVVTQFDAEAGAVSFVQELRRQSERRD